METSNRRFFKSVKANINTELLYMFAILSVDHTFYAVADSPDSKKVNLKKKKIYAQSIALQNSKLEVTEN